MCQRIQRDTGFEESVTPRRFRTTVLTDLYDQTIMISYVLLKGMRIEKKGG